MILDKYTLLEVRAELSKLPIDKNRCRILLRPEQAWEEAQDQCIHAVEALLVQVLPLVPQPSTLEAEQRAREECAKAIRKSCEVCGGSGYATYVNVEHGEDFPECEYCGRPIAVIRASTPDSGGKEVKGDGHT